MLLVLLSFFLTASSHRMVAENITSLYWHWIISVYQVPFIVWYHLNTQCLLLSSLSRLFVTVCWPLASSWGPSTRDWTRESSRHRRRSWAGPRVLTQRWSSPAPPARRGLEIQGNSDNRRKTFQDMLTKALVFTTHFCVSYTILKCTLFYIHSFASLKFVAPSWLIDCFPFFFSNGVWWKLTAWCYMTLCTGYT